MIALALILALSGGDESTALHQELRAKELELVSLQRARRELQADRQASVELPPAPTRLALLRSVDLDAARRLGVGPAQARVRLLSGLDQELSDLIDQQPASRQGVLQRLLELEEELHARALRMLRQWGLPEPPGLARSSSDSPDESAPAELAASRPTTEPADAEPRPAAAPRRPPHELLLIAATAYADGLWSDSLQAFEGLELELDGDTLEQHYRAADCLLKLRRTDEAAAAFRVLAERFPEAKLGQQAEWNAKVAEALSLLAEDGKERR